MFFEWFFLFFWMIKNLDHNLDYIVSNCMYKVPSHFVALLDVVIGDLNRMDGNADDNSPYMDHFAQHKLDTIFVNNVAWWWSAFDRKNNQHLLGIFAVCANYRIVHLDRCLNWQNAAKIREN